jgi:hypothetical protein
MDAKFVWSVHALVHHIIHGQQGFLTRLDCRRTDDRAGRSAALDKLNLRLAQDLQGLCADVAQAERGLNGCTQLEIAFIYRGSVNC